MRFLVPLAALCLSLAFALNLFASPPPGGLLIQAYATLAQADHDYKGHRADAMKQIEAAGKAMGVNVRGDGRNREPQGLSDAQLRAAQGMLLQARAGLRGRALRHVDRALRHISTALRIK